jgi:hypothetical protein
MSTQLWSIQLRILWEIYFTVNMCPLFKLCVAVEFSTKLEIYELWIYASDRVINPLNAELNPICHLLILLGDLTFMGTCIVSIF